MTATLIDLGQVREAVSDDLAGLRAYLAQIIGEPFRFVRVSPGDELTLHLGDSRPARSAKLKNRLYGTYVLGVRASSWVLKAGAAMLVASGTDAAQPPGGFGRPIRNDEIEADPLIRPGSVVLAAVPFAARVAGGIGLRLGFSDGSVIHVLPAPPEAAETPEDRSLPELTDWQLLSPGGLLSAGPGLTWGFKPATRPS